MICSACRRENPDDSAFCEECGARLDRRCPSCGNPCAPAAKFCRSCGASLAARAAEAAEKIEARKVVTIVFADLIGSTALHERLDPESVSRVMERYHRTVRVPVEKHGGTVVQLLGDGVMCAFGVPRVAEDDAIRAVRAGVAVQRAFREFARDEEGVVGDVGLRVAVNTGEVVVSDDNPAGIGDPLNVAARLQQEARDGDVLIGESTERLVGTLVTLEPIGKLTLKGRAETVAAYRVVSLDRPAGVSATPFVGRDDELRRVMAVYDGAVADRRARLTVVLGSPGLGKSRLVSEFARQLGDRATLLSAHCEAAGAATFAPVARALRAHLGIDDGAPTDAVREAIAAATFGDDAERKRITDGITALLGGVPATPEETFFVVRRFLAGLAAAKPVVLVIDDLHWAEPMLLDLTEHLVQWTSDAPLLVLVAARPELHEARSSMTITGGFVAEVVTLAGLDAGAATQLAANVIGADALPAAVAGRVLATSEGNPLFVGELVRMLVQDGALKREGDRWTAGTDLAQLEMPPTIQALLAARIERLRPEERAVLERAAVVGRQFSRAAIAHLLPRENAELDARLEALRRSELVESDTGWFLGEPALRFRHVLIRDAAYRRVLKGTRAELHSRFADWVVGRVGEAVEHDETIGWHLEQAHQNLRELGPIDVQGRALGDRAARYLATAGQRALARDDLPLAGSLLGRALDRLDPADPARADLALDWCEALLSAGDVGPAVRAIAELGRFTADSARLKAWHDCFVGQLAALTDPQSLRVTADTLAAAAETLAAAGDAPGEAKAYSVQALALGRLGKVGASEAALDRALAAARRGHDRRRSNAVLAGAPVAALWGPSPVTRASGRCLDVVRVLRITQGSPAVEAVALRCQGVLEALRGRGEAARRMIASSRRMVEELGITQRLLEADVFAGLIELLEGDASAAEGSLRSAYEGLRDQGLGIDAAQAAALLARALLALGRAADAEVLSHESERLAGDDLKAAIAWRGVRAEALAQRGEHAQAIELARAAVDLAAATDALLDHADARLALAAALRAAGRGREAAAEEARAIELWEAKGATLLAESARRAAGRFDRARIVPPEARETVTTRANRRVEPNAATSLSSRLAAAIVARDLDALRALYPDDWAMVDHTTGAVLDREAALDSMKRFFRCPDPRFHSELWASLGNALALGRSVMSASGFSGGDLDVGAFRREEIFVSEGDGHGRERRIEVFAADHAGEAVARLFERYAELLPQGPERSRAAATARAVAALLGPAFDLDRFATGVAPALEFADHRRIAVEPSRGAEAWLSGLRPLLDLTDEIANRVDDVLALRFDGFLVHWTNFGTYREGGGAYERPFLWLTIFGTDGLASRTEIFDAEREVDALARFDKLTAPRGVTGLRRVRPNAATANAARSVAAIAARDAETLSLLLADDMQITDHTTKTTFDRQGMLSSQLALLRAESLRNTYEPLASLGESLALFHNSVSGSGFLDRKLDVGPFQIDEIVLMETDRQGRRWRDEEFAVDQLGDAVVRLYERYAELLPEGPERGRAAAVARSLAGLLGPIEPDRWSAVIEPSVELVDHRMLGTWSSRGAERLLQNLRSYGEVADRITVRIDDVFSVRPDAFIGRWMTFGTDRAGGGAYERPHITVVLCGEDGRAKRIEMFDVDREAEAFARFDELTTPSIATRPRRVRRNAATANLGRLDAMIAARDANGLEALFADDVAIVNHHLAGGVYDRRGAIATWRSLLSARNPTCRHEPLATFGDSLALCRQSLSATGFAGARFDVGAYERDAIALVEVDSSGLQRRAEFFATERLGEAIIRLYERYADLLPEGPGRERAATAARSLAIIVARDLDRYVTAIAPDGEFLDQRLLGMGRAVGPDAVVRGMRSLFELADQLVFRVDDILCLCEGGFVTRETNSGTGRDGGGAFERHFIHIVAFGTDGLVSRVQLLDADRDADALTRFDELTRLPSPVVKEIERRVRANWATAWVADLASRDPSCGFEVLATLGDALAVCRVSMSFEREEIHLYEVDAQVRQRAAESFAVDRLGDVGARLYERFAELLPEGPRRERAAATARSVTALVGPFDPDRYATALGPVFESVDRRSLVGLNTAQGPEAFLHRFRSLADLADDLTIRLDDVYAARPDAFLIRNTNSGTARAGGGRFERQYLSLWVFGDDGLATHQESFDSDRVAEALARFDELTTPRPTKRKRRVRPNAATANMDRVDEAFASGDVDRLAALFADDGTFIENPIDVVYDREGMIFSYRTLLAAQDPSHRYEPLGTLGNSLALWRLRMSASGLSSTRFDVAEYLKEQVGVLEVDSNGRQLHAELFAPEHLGDAVVRLYERYAALLPEGAERERAAATARSIAATLGPLDRDRWAAAIDSSVEVIDHRRLGTWSSRGAEALQRNLGAYVEVAESLTLRVDDVLGVRPEAFLWHGTTFGTDRAGGGAFERPYILLVRFRVDGRLTHAEFFDADRDAEALARFDALTFEPVAPRKRRVRPNAATRHTALVDAALAAKDADAIRRLGADDFVIVDYVEGAEYGVDGAAYTLRIVMKGRDVRVAHEPFATLGDSLGLFGLIVAASGATSRDFDVGPYETARIVLVETNSKGLAQRVEFFANDQFDDAIARLYERYAESLPEGPERERATATARSLATVRPPDVDSLAAGLAANVVFTDHRTVGLGLVRGAEAVERSFRAFAELVEEHDVRVDDIFGLRSDAILVRVTHFGTQRAGGGAFERHLCRLWVFGADGRITQFEVFDADREAEALARFDELTAAKPRQRRVRLNSVTAVMARVDIAVTARDAATVASLHSADFELVDHLTGAVLDRDGVMLSFHTTLSCRDLRHSHVPLATLGDSLALFRLSMSASGVSDTGVDTGPFEIGRIVLAELGSDGLGRCVEFFSNDRLGEGITRLYERYAEFLLKGPGRARAAVTARSVAAMLGPYDPDRYASTFAPAILFSDHRTMGFGRARREVMLAGLRALLEIADDISTAVDDVLDLHPGGLVVHYTQTGVDRRSGGSYERRFLLLLVFDDEGLLTHWEQFDPDREAEALARFDELTAIS